MEYCASDFRAMARDALRGHWWTAIITSFVASLIGAWLVDSGLGSVDLDSETFPNMTVGEIPSVWIAVLVACIGVVLVYAIAMLIFSGAGMLGYARFNLKLVDGEKPTLGDLFSQFDRLGEGFVMNFLRGLYVFLWTLLFVIPGIMKNFSYAMTPYILAENPGKPALECINESKEMTDGYKMELFMLSLSFVGWLLLGIVTLGIAFIWVIPYMHATFANAYRWFNSPWDETA